MAWALGRLIVKMRRFDSTRPMEYLAVWERTKAGWPHLHVLLRGPFIPQRLISRWWSSLAKSPIVDIRPLHGSRQGARYVTKYLTKDPDPFFQGRSIRASAKFLIEPMRPQGKRFCTLGPVRIYEGSVWNWLMDELAGLRLVDLDDGGQALSAPWSAVAGPESIKWLRWERQQTAVRRYERPPPPPSPLLDGSPWAERPRTAATQTPEGAPAR